MISEKEFLTKKIADGWGFARIFNHLSKMPSNEQRPSLGIFRSIVKTMRSNGTPLSDEKMLYHFRTKVDPVDYEGVKKQEVIDDLRSDEW